MICVSLIRLRGIRQLVKHFWVCLWGCLRKRLAFAFIDWEKINFASVDGHHSVGWGLRRLKRWRKGECKCFKVNFDAMKIWELICQTQGASEQQSLSWEGSGCVLCGAHKHFSHNTWCIITLSVYEEFLWIMGCPLMRCAVLRVGDAQLRLDARSSVSSPTSHRPSVSKDSWDPGFSDMLLLLQS